MENNNKIKKINSIWLMMLVLTFTFIIPSSYAQAVTKEDMSNTCTIGGVDSKGSFIMAALTLCLPGVLESVYKFKNIKCENIVCQYEAVVQGLDPGFCEKQASYKTCRYFVGEIFALPFFNFIDNIREMVANVLANPVGMLYSAVVQSARVTVGKCSLGALCNVVPNMPLNIAVPLLAVTDGASAVQFIVDIMENGFFPDFSSEDYCDELDDIREELEEVVNNL